MYLTDSLILRIKKKQFKPHPSNVKRDFEVLLNIFVNNFQKWLNFKIYVIK